jgi:hypothetical protein
MVTLQQVDAPTWQGVRGPPPREMRHGVRISDD